MKEFKLSDKELDLKSIPFRVFAFTDVKEFIRLLKDKIRAKYSNDPMKDMDLIHLCEIDIDNLTGDLK